MIRSEVAVPAPTIVDIATGEIISTIPGVISARGWVIPEGTPPEEVIPVVNWALAAGRRLPLVAFDGYAYVEQVAGDSYTSLIDTTGYDYGSVRNGVWAVRHVPVSRRRDTLTLSHYSEVASLPPDDQIYWLDRAEAEELSQKALRAAIAAEKHLASPAARVFGDGTAIVYRTDALDFLESIEAGTVDLLLTDPPYSTDVDDIEGFVQAWVPLALSRLKPSGRAYVCAGAYPGEMAAYLAAFGVSCANILVWTYRNTMGPSPTHEYKLNWQAIFHLYGPDAPPLTAPALNEQFSVIDITAPDGRHGTRVHAWQKPDELADRLIAHSTRAGDIVIDPFSGTGTFLAAAARAGCTALGSEIDPEMLAYCASRGIEVGE